MFIGNTYLFIKSNYMLIKTSYTYLLILEKSLTSSRLKLSFNYDCLKPHEAWIDNTVYKGEFMGHGEEYRSNEL